VIGVPLSLCCEWRAHTSSAPNVFFGWRVSDGYRVPYVSRWVPLMAVRLLASELRFLLLIASANSSKRRIASEREGLSL
jgi:hypothetical protein